MVTNKKDVFSGWNKDKLEGSGVPKHFLPYLSAPFVKGRGKGILGIELEVEGSNLPSGSSFSERVRVGKKTWDMHREGSLRGPNGEYVTTGAVTLDEAIKLINNLWEDFLASRVRLNNSNRTSTHVHLNIQNLKVNEITSIIALWNTFEEVLIEWCGEERTSNHFCLPSKQSSSGVELWKNALETGEFHFVNDYKYLALNYGRFNDLGTLETRCMKAMDNPEEIITWCKFVHALREEAIERYRNPFEISHRSSEAGVTEMFHRICERAGIVDTFFKEVTAINNFESKCFEGFRRVQPILHVYNWDLLMDKLDEKYVPKPFSKKKK